MRLALFLPPCTDARVLAGTAQLAESSGFEAVWAADSPLLWLDPWVSLGVIADRTSNLTLGTAVTNPVTRHPAVTASALATLHQLAPGRVVLGIGIGDSAVRTLGQRPASLAELGTAVTQIRALFAGDSVEYGGRRMRMHGAPGSPPRIFMAASGPRALALAGELADGVIAIVGASPTLIERTLGFIKQGLDRAGRRRSDIEVWLGMFAEITADPSRAARSVKPWAGWSFEIGDAAALKAVGIDAGPGAAAAAVYPDLVHAEPDWEAGIRAVDEVISDEAALAYAEQFCLVGSAEACARKLERAVAAGADGFYLMHRHVYELPVKLIDDVREQLIPALATTGTSPKR